MKALVLFGLALTPAGLQIVPLNPDCTETHCKITVGEAKSVSDLQQRALGDLMVLREENARLKRLCPVRND